MNEEIEIPQADDWLTEEEVKMVRKMVGRVKITITSSAFDRITPEE